MHWRVLMLGSLCYFKSSINVQKGNVMGRTGLSCNKDEVQYSRCVCLFFDVNITYTRSTLFISYFSTKYGGFGLGELVHAQTCSWSNQKQLRVQPRLNCDVSFMFGIKWYRLNYLKWTEHRTLLNPNKLFNIFYFQVYFNHRSSKITDFQSRITVEFASDVDV